MTSIAAIRSWDLFALNDIVAALDLGAERTDNAVDAVDRAVDDARIWTGAGALAQKRAIDDLVCRGRSLRNFTDQVAESLGQIVADLVALRDHVIRTVDDAVAQQLTVADSGQVISDTADPDVIDFHQSRITSAINDLQHSDEAGAQRLRLLHAAIDIVDDPDSAIARRNDRLISDLRTASPNRRRSVVTGLPPSEVTALIARAPELLGNLDGVPFDVRIAANRVAIRNARDDELDARTPNLERVRRYDDMLRRDRTFLSFSPEGNGRMIELIGEMRPGIPGVAVLVPGTGTNLSSSGDVSRSSRALSDATRGPVIVYVDGDLPQTLTGTALSRTSAGGILGGIPGAVGGFVAGLRDSAADPSFARDLAPRLVGFGRELDIEIAGRAPGTPTTVIGHSYGGAVVGSAEQLGLRADRLVYASSAGTGVFGGEWHNPAANVQRYSMTAPGDPIHLAQESPIPFGGDPDNRRGVTRLDTGNYSDGSPVSGIEGHYRYWDDPASTAFGNLVAVITGQTPTLYSNRLPDLPPRLR